MVTEICPVSSIPQQYSQAVAFQAEYNSIHFALLVLRMHIMREYQGIALKPSPQINAKAKQTDTHYEYTVLPKE